MQTWNAAQYQDRAPFVAELGNEALLLLNPQPDEHILDLGCGDGSLTAHIAQISADVIGVDASESMVCAARQKGLHAVVMSGDALTYSNQFDAVFSNAALHWMPQCDAVIAGVRQALKKGGRFVAEFGGKGNIAAIVQAMHEVIDRHSAMGSFHNPWYFPSESEYAERLASHGFVVDEIQLIPRPTPLPHGIRDWLQIFARYVISGLPTEVEQQFLTETEDLLRQVLFSATNGWHADYVRLRFSARLP